MKFSIVFTFLAFTISSTLATTIGRQLEESKEASCTEGKLLCCDSLQNANSSNVAGLLGSLGIPVQGITGLVGLNCNPVIDGGFSQACSQTPVCCTGENFNGVVTLGCTPITAQDE